jgi:hypothetical protein
MDFYFETGLVMVNEKLLAGRSAGVHLTRSGSQVAMVENAGRFHPSRRRVV